ncbi:MAG: DMT family transporter [[Clostridium] aminophilum]|uniref:DMT family transporter n=1 Tax=[Clostridium] aminophilum TaxID=1526 RepID=UPI0026F36356|nr:DMT family transporter [[Clostridium] aminophilum]MDD6197237.1 DMT family transporter [[Clostridium] aminophilum]
MVGEGHNATGLWSRPSPLALRWQCEEKRFMFYPLVPVFSALLGVMLLGESLSGRFFIGGAMIVSTVIVSCLPDKRGSRETEEKNLPDYEQTER